METPSSPQSGGASGAAWLDAGREQSPLQRYAEVLRERRGLIVLTVLLATAAAVVYGVVAPRSFQARASLYVTPVPADDSTLSGLGLITASSDPTRDVQTAAGLVATIPVAQRAAALLSSPAAPRRLLRDVDVVPLAQSNILAVRAHAARGRAAQRLANAFATAAVEQRTALFQRQLRGAIATIREHVTTSSGAERRAAAAALARLEGLRGRGDPTIRVASLAELPSGPTSPRPVLGAVVGVLGGLVLGIAGAFVLQALDPRLRRENQLRELYRLPVLGRVPPVSSRRHPLRPDDLPVGAREAYRTLRATLGAMTPPHEERGRSILVTSASAGEGKTTTALNLAWSFAAAGSETLLVEADLRRPTLAETLGVPVGRGLSDVLIDAVELPKAVVRASEATGNLELLLAGTRDPTGQSLADRLFLPATQRLVEETSLLAEAVVIDAPPLAEVVDALPLAQAADEVLIVVRLGVTHTTKLRRLMELLANNGIRPAGIAILGARSIPTGDDGYLQAEVLSRRERRQRRRARGRVIQPQPVQKAPPQAP